MTGGRGRPQETSVTRSTDSLMNQSLMAATFNPAIKQMNPIIFIWQEENT